jgi:predicted membrane protein
MGCDTCKGKKSKDKKSKGKKEVKMFGSGKTTIFLLKLTAFIVVIALLPAIVLLLLYMVFGNLFLPKKETENIFSDVIASSAKRIQKRRIRKEERKREKEFKNNRSYKGDSELLDIEVFTNEGDNNTEVSE